MKPIGIYNIWQKDNHTFCIDWSDGATSAYRLSDLQSRCPCAGCVDEKTGLRVSGGVKDGVRAVKIESVGRYALRIQFTNGCSNGIFSFDMLRNL